MYSIEDLRTFVAISQRGGITAAAKGLGLAPATVSHRLTKIERHLGVSLFLRNSRTVALSPEGRVFLDRVEGILEELANAEVDIGSHGGRLRGHLRVTMAPWILSRFILPNLRRLQEAEPGLSFEFLAVDRFVNLAEEGQDCAIRVGSLADSNVLARKLADNRRILCASPDYLARHGTPRSLPELRGHIAVCLPWQRDWGLGADMPAVAVTVSNSDTLTDAAKFGSGLALKSELAITPELRSGDLVSVLPELFAAQEAPISALRLPHLKGSRKLDAFVAFTAGCFARA